MGFEQNIANYFKFEERDATLNGELRAGLTTFLTMAYILLVNPAMLSVGGIPFDDALFATAIAAFVGCVVMGLWANSLRFGAGDGSQRLLHLRRRPRHGH